MCTSIALRKVKALFGRNMDIDYNFGESIVNTPRNFPLHFKKVGTIEKHYAFIGTAAMEDNFPLYAEAMNENGLYIAALKFPENAYCNETQTQGKINLAPYEIIPYVLSKCRNTSEALSLLSECQIVAIPFSDKLPLSPLHWHIADKGGSLTLEKTKDGMNIYHNPTDVLTNNPPFPFHLENRGHYENLSPRNPENSDTAMLGLGTVGLTGDFTPVSRFIRMDYLVRNTPINCDTVSHFFHILDNAAIPKGAVVTPDGKYHFTSYSCCFDADTLEMYFKTYENTDIRTSKLTPDGNALLALEMNNKLW